MIVDTFALQGKLKLLLLKDWPNYGHHEKTQKKSSEIELVEAKFHPKVDGPQNAGCKLIKANSERKKKNVSAAIDQSLCRYMEMKRW